MKNQLTINILLVILFIIFGIFLFNNLPTKTLKDGNIDTQSFTPTEIIASFSFDNGLHEYTGSIDFPNSCYELETKALVMESFPEQVILIFETNNVSSDILCTQVITPKKFRILFQATEQATVSAEYNGKPIDLLLVQEAALDNLEAMEEPVK